MPANRTGVASSELFSSVIGQEPGIAKLVACAALPVHAYLIAGPEGAGHSELARGFAAALVCPKGGCGRCDSCRRALSGSHPDVVEFERSGAQLSVEQAAQIVALAYRKPLGSARQVIVVPEIHLALRSAPVLLKTIEEPPATTVFVLLAFSVPPELSTIASRCVRIDLRAVPNDALAGALRKEGVADDLAGEVAEAAFGSVERARLLAHDEAFLSRRALWRSIPAKLDGTGSSVSSLVDDLVASADEALGPLRESFDSELASIESSAATSGERTASQRKALEDRQRREERRWRTDEFRSGLSVLAREYRDRMTEVSGRGPGRMAELVKALAAVEQCSRELVRNPNERMMFQALLVKLSSLPT